jgi:hypothetical protein
MWARPVAIAAACVAVRLFYSGCALATLRAKDVE